MTLGGTGIRRAPVAVPRKDGAEPDGGIRKWAASQK